MAQTLEERLASINQLYAARWQYIRVERGPVLGPQPKLARGTGRTNQQTPYPGTGVPGGFMVEPNYEPSLYDYDPGLSTSFLLTPPRTIGAGVDGLELVGTYRVHDFVGADRMLHHMRSAPNYQVMAFGPDFRDTLEWKQAEIYQVANRTRESSMLARNNYFLGYTTDTQTASQIGGTSLGYMGG